MAWQLGAIALVVVTSIPVLAQPDFGGVQRVEGLTVFPDARDRMLFYYVPGPIRIVSENGVPQFDFLQTRYAGTAQRGDQGSFQTFSQVTLSVERIPTDPEVLDMVGRQLGADGSAVELRPVPLHSLDAGLVYAVPGSDTTSSIGEKSSETENDEGIWQEKTFTIRLTDAGSQAMWHALQQGKSVISFAYAYLASGVDDAVDDPGVEAPAAGPEASQASASVPAAASGAVTRPVFADAFDIELDPARFPDHFTRVDLNGDRVPPGYAAIAIRCYDFRDGLRQDLWEKQVEIEAESVSGRPARISVHFSVDELETYKHAARFPYAVRLDRPYRFRLIEVTVDGDEQAGDWIERTSWVEPLDVTTPYVQLAALRSQHDDELEEQ